MRVITEAHHIELPAAVVSVGMFDGVHRGHRKLLSLLRQKGDRRGVPTAVVTFDPHPRAIVRPDTRPKMLSTLEDRIALLAGTGAVDYCLVLHFDHERSQQSADDFVTSVLIRQLGLQELVVGENFSCGKARQGSVAYLSRLGAERGFAVTAAPLVSGSSTAGSVRSSSTETRRLIECGDLAGASSMLERAHEMTVRITHAPPPSSFALKAAFPATMCTPPSADYVGAVRAGGAGSHWIPALLQVGQDKLSSRRWVRVVAHEALKGTCGDAMRIRFYGRSGLLPQKQPADQGTHPLAADIAMETLVPILCDFHVRHRQGSLDRHQAKIFRHGEADRAGQCRDQV